MPGFDAGTVVEPLKYTFRPFVDIEGVVKEPNDKQVGAIISGVKELGKKIVADAGLGDVDTDDPMAVLMALDNLDPNVFVQAMDDMAALFAELCSGHPSKAQILKVPFRIRLAFFTWLMGEVTSPEASSGAGNGATATPPAGAAAPSSTQ